MARKIIWSIRAQQDRIAILNYWIQRNQSHTYSKKLNKLIVESIRIISLFPHIGQPTEIDGIRIKTVRDYLIIYEQLETEIHILTIWDHRQDPERLKEILI